MKLCKVNRDGSFSTQATRKRILNRIANQLYELGYKHMQAKSLKPKHVEALVSLWRSPLAGGPASASLTIEQRALNEGARETISRELGHSREQISATYLGR
jgi:hypothetical protein